MNTPPRISPRLSPRLSPRNPKHQTSRKKRYATKFSGVLAVALASIIYLYISVLGLKQRHREREAFDYHQTGHNILFKCPNDGRLGLHIVHTRFLIGQAKANSVFTASRLFLLRSFLIPNLNAQTSQSFILYAAHDPDLSMTTIEALQATLLQAAQKSLFGPEIDKISPSLDIASIFRIVSQWDPRVWDASLLVTSRIDLDDLAHVEAVAAVQEAACGTTPPSKPGVSVRLVYMDRGMLWYPSAEEPYGETCEWKNTFRSHLAIMQSMVLAASEGKKGRKILQNCPMNVYSYPHYKPQEVEHLKPRGCGKVVFSAAGDVIRWRPDEGLSDGSGGFGSTSGKARGEGAERVGCLYTKTASSWSYGKLKHKGTVCKPADPERLARLFSGTPQRFGAVNAMFVGLEHEALALVANKTKEHLE